jgi:succinoglycan biosynthesis protein ExoA
VYLGCWPRSVFDRVGLFDPGLVRNQDDEFNFRLRRSGGRIWQSPGIQSSYTPRSSILSLFRQYLQYGFWKVAVIRKHSAVASWRHLAPVVFVGSIVTAPVLVALFVALGRPAVAVLVGGAFAMELGIYSLACVASALPCARSLGLRGFVAMPVIIAVHHIAYGLGFLIGLLMPARSRSSGVGATDFFTALTR